MARTTTQAVQAEAEASTTTEVVETVEADAQATATTTDVVEPVEADAQASDGTASVETIEGESVPSAPQDQDAPQPSGTEDSLDTAQAEDTAEVQPAAGGITVTITGPKQGRWRAGRHFSAEPKVIDIDTLTEEDLEALRGDPMLIIVVG